MRRLALIGFVLAGTALVLAPSQNLGPTGPAAAQDAGCTPCECRVAWCEGNAMYWPIIEQAFGWTVRNETYVVTWGLGLGMDANGSRNASFRGDSTMVGFGEKAPPPDADVAAYDFQARVENATYPGNQSLTFYWSLDSFPHVRIFGHGGATGPDWWLVRSAGPDTRSSPTSAEATTPGLDALAVLLLGPAVVWCARGTRHG